MASANCWKCLLRPSTTAPFQRLAPIPISVSTAPFSTALALNAPPKGKDQKLGGHIRAGKKMKLGRAKKSVAVRAKAPVPGERKAFRKRIQLSNNNALPVAGLESLSRENMVDPASVGSMLAIPDDVVDKLRASEAFKTTQTWGLFRQPTVLMRKEAVELARKIRDAAGKKETLRLVIDGEKIAGKSTVLLQGLSTAFLNDFVVINLPEAQDLTTASTEYAPIPGTDPVQYMQPVYVFKLLASMRKVNEAIFSQLTTNQPHTKLVAPIHAGSSLLQLIDVAKEADHAVSVFQALWAELTDPSTARPPLMFALDGLAHAMKISDYRSPTFELIHSHDLAMVRLFTDALSGAVKLPHGGAVLAAVSRGNAPKSPSMELALAQRHAEQTGVEAPTRDSFFRGYDERVEEVLRSVQVMQVRGISKAEARSLMEYWAASGVLRRQVDEQVVTGTWAMGGHGIVGEMERASLLTMRL